MNYTAGPYGDQLGAITNPDGQGRVDWLNSIEGPLHLKLAYTMIFWLVVYHYQYSYKHGFE